MKHNTCTLAIALAAVGLHIATSSHSAQSLPLVRKGRIARSVCLADDGLPVVGRLDGAAALGGVGVRVADFGVLRRGFRFFVVVVFDIAVFVDVVICSVVGVVRLSPS